MTGRALTLIRSAVAATSLPLVSVESATFAAGGRSAAVALVEPDHKRDVLAVVSRREFDAALLAAAGDAGATVIASRATAFERTTAGWTIAAGGKSLTAAWLIGADGANSVVRKHVARPFSRADLSIATGYFVHGATGADVAIDFDDTPTGYVWSFPRADHLAVGACGQADSTTAPSLLGRSEKWIREHVAKPASLERYSWPIPSLRARTIELERPSGDRWLLAGDAAGLVDPITREGIYFALLSGELAASSLGGASAAMEYGRRLREAVYNELHRAARLKARFFRPELLALLVSGLNRSVRVRRIMADLVSGNQTYEGLRRRLLGTFELRLMLEMFRL